jgi:hypothetical protein
VSEYHNDKTAASDPGRLTLSPPMLRRLQPELFGVRSLFVRHAWGRRTLSARQTVDMIAEHLGCGDTRAALVAGTAPLIVAAYTDELDCVVLLRFPDWLTAEHKLKPGRRLLTVNTYGKGKRTAPDLQEGSGALHQWTNYYPLIAEFLSADIDRMAARKQAIDTAEWHRAAKLAERLMRQPNPSVRDGRPLWSNRPAGTGTSQRPGPTSLY